MRISGKRILVMVIMGILISSVIASAVSYFNRSTTTSSSTSQISVLNERINSAVDFCLKSLPKGTSACDSQLEPVINRICTVEGNNNAQYLLDACHNGKVAQYYKIRNNEIQKSKTIVSHNSNNNSRS
jgi:hypothetical protein